MVSPLEQFDVINLGNIFQLDLNKNYFFLRWIRDYFFLFNNIIIPLILINLIFFFFIIFFKKEMKLIPENWELFVEQIYRFIFGIIKQQLGESGYVYFPFIFFIFNFIVICNLLSLLPFGIALTSHLIIILLVSISSCLSILLIGLVKNKLKFLRLFIPESPLALLPILIPIEIFSYLIRMFSLAIRLAANILAGHTLVYIISSFVIVSISTYYLFYFFAIIPLLAVMCLEIGVALLQAYVFTVLICIYLSDSLNFKEH